MRAVIEQSSPLAPLPTLLLTARGFAAEVSLLQQHRTSEYVGDEPLVNEMMPSSRMAIIMQMRSMLGSLIQASMEDIELITAHFDAGKVHFRDRVSGEEFVLKSDRFREREMTQRYHDTPFPDWEHLGPERELVTALFYRFDGSRLLTLSRAQVEIDRRGSGRPRFFLLEPTIELGRFLATVDGDVRLVEETEELAAADGSSTQFEQAGDDDFDDFDEAFDEDAGE